MRRTIVTMGGGGFSMEPENPALDLWILSLATPTLRRSGQDPDWRPTVCFIPTASGDSERYVLNFYKAFAKLPCRATHLSLFQRETLDVRTILHAADVIYVGGGNTANLLAVWRLHNVDKALRAAWRRGAVLAGVSAGSLCWFEAGTTDSFGPRLAPLADGLGFLPGSHCPHYDGEAQRRPLYQRLVAAGELPAGWACDDSAAIRWQGRRAVEFVASKPGPKVWRIERMPDGKVRETVREPRVLRAGAT